MFSTFLMYVCLAGIAVSEIAARRAVWQPTMQEIPSKWLKRYRKLATNASKGAVLA